MQTAWSCSQVFGGAPNGLRPKRPHLADPFGAYEGDSRRKVTFILPPSTAPAILPNHCGVSLTALQNAAAPAGYLFTPRRGVPVDGAEPSHYPGKRAASGAAGITSIRLRAPWRTKWRTIPKPVDWISRGKLPVK